MADLRIRFTTFDKRFHFRANWPLWTAGVAVLFVLICLAYSQNVPRYPDYSRSPVIYPFLIFSSSIFLLIPLILLASLFLVGIWCLRRRKGIPIFGIALLANGVSCYACFATTLWGF